MTDTVAVPSHLVPVEVEREVLSGATRAMTIVNDEPLHSDATAALDAVAAFPSDFFSQYTDRRIHQAIVAAYQRHGSHTTPSLVIQELRTRNRTDDIPVYTELSLSLYGIAPVRGIESHLAVVARYSSLRAEYDACRNRQAEIAGDPRI